MSKFDLNKFESLSEANKVKAIFEAIDNAEYRCNEDGEELVLLGVANLATPVVRPYVQICKNICSYIFSNKELTTAFNNGDFEKVLELYKNIER